MSNRLNRQLNRLGLEVERAPTQEEWAKFVAEVESQYTQMEGEYRMLEHSLDIATTEMTEVSDRQTRDMRAFQAVLGAIDGAVGALQRLPTGPVNDETSHSRSAVMSMLVSSFDDQVSRAVSEISPSNDHNTVLSSVRTGFSHLLDEFKHMLEVTSNTEQQRREREITEAVQRMLLPNEALVRPNFRVAGASRAAGVCGGDWWGASALRDNRTLLLIGDVTGHGLTSALLTAVAKASYDVARAALKPLTLESLLKLMNIAIFENAKRQFFMTACGITIDETTLELKIANAGHVLPLVVNAQGAVPVAVPGGALGMSTSIDIEVKTLQLQPDEMLVLYTDGLTEARNSAGEEFGDKRLRTLLHSLRTQTPEAICEEVFATVTRYSDAIVEDDQTIVVLRPGK